MQLTNIRLIEGCIELVTGLHIGAGSEEMQIGGTDNPVVRNPVDRRPYIPGSSLKGKMRGLLEWHAGTVGDTDGKPVGFRDVAGLSDEKRQRAESILKLFGGAPQGGSSDEKLVHIIRETGPTRLAFWDCPLNDDWAKRMDDRGLSLTEVKMETAIDRIGGAAATGSLRNTERVPAGARFDFRLTMRVHDGEDLLTEVLRGLRLIELTGLGGAGSRGYGKVRFTDLTRDGGSIQPRYDAVGFGS